MDRFKEKMIDNLKKTNEDLKNFNYKYMGTKNKLLAEQKQKLFMIIEKKNEIIKDLNKQIDMLKYKIYENEKDQEIHKLVEYNLAYKLILKNNVMKSLDLSKNSCNIKITEQFLELIDKLKLEYLDINQNTMDPTEKETFRKRTNELNDIKIIY